ncbi:TRAP transporter substrate-binding protein DctP [Pseudomaricurvus alkylphenolicus]|uniref:TRAP transporter substrate-binding protein DctP n=1 Tax=Pseudomaricurvus alkylphenolicus TaxID=1306991 RepID=UPI0014220B1A|nr:TRAP transporter substrate-binding protein DctP [Pseudomaricurvus alkylphenolicus]NIB40517.1 TRAP transporter substrate-binding protein DctP [Pseudomaricurvus alkylphenolicus]
MVYRQSLLRALVTTVALCLPQWLTANTDILRLTHSVPGQMPIARLVDEWAQRIEQRAQGRLTIKIYPGNQLLRTKSMVPSVIRGHVNAAMISNLDWGLTIPEMGIFSLPFGFSGYEEFSDFLRSPALADSDMFAPVGVHNLGWVWVTDNQGFTSNNGPLVTPEHFRQLKIRGMNPVINASLMALGAAPVSMSGGEAYQALETNLIQASVTTLPAVYRRRYFEVQDWCTISPLFVTVFSLVVNKQWWDQQDESVKQIISEEGRWLEQQSVLLAKREDASLPDMIASSGMQVYQQTKADIAVLRAQVMDEWRQSFLQTSGAKGLALLKHFEQWRADRPWGRSLQEENNDE